MRKSALCSGPISRRSILEIGGLSMMGLGMGDFLKFQTQATEDSSLFVDKDTSVIFIWLPGGLPHMESYDMKPDAPSEYRGDFRPIRTNVPGIEVCELLPMHAKIADKFSIIRSMHHEFTHHGGAIKRMMTGRPPKRPIGAINDAPAVSSIVKKVLGSKKQSKFQTPICVSEVDVARSGIDYYGMGSAWLGSANNTFIVAGDPSDKEFKVNNTRVKKEMANAMGSFNAQAEKMLMSDTVREAFDLKKESTKTRDRYGMHAYGQRALMARRLVEAGSRFVTMVWEHPGGVTPKNCYYNWDCHAFKCDIFADCKWKMPYYDQALTALIDDVYQRGLDKKTLIVVGSDFGHTPKITTRRGTNNGVMQPGRDHWPKAMSVLVSGGGMNMGQIIGATNSKGEHPIERAMTPNDLWATVYQHLGINHGAYLKNLEGLPMQILPFGKPIEELNPQLG